MLKSTFSDTPPISPLDWLIIYHDYKDIDKVLKLLDVLNTSIYVSVLVNDSILFD